VTSTGPAADAQARRTEVPLDDPVSHEGSSGAERWAFWCFVAVVLAGLPTLMWIGSYRWFFSDEWSFLANRSISIDGLLRPHLDQHMVALPVVYYRVLHWVFGLRSYWPYQLGLVLLHLGLACLLRVVMRRAGVRPWIATVAAGGFILLGAAEDNILWAFQIAFVATLVAGIGQMVLADHDGPIDRRDWFGLGAGLVALMCSGVAPSLVMATGVVCLLRRRWVAALFHTMPLGILFLVWWFAEGAQGVLRAENSPSFGVGDYVSWMASAARGLFATIGHFPLLGLVFAGILVVGWALAWRTEHGQLWQRAAVPAAMVFAAIVSMSAAGPSRFLGGFEAARGSRYLGLMAALALPAVALGGDAVVRRWPRAHVFVVVLFLVPIPFNAFDFRANPILTENYFRGVRANVVGLASLPLASRVPRWVRPNESLLGQQDLSVGWLLDEQAAGRLPAAEDMGPIARSMTPVQLGVALTRNPVDEGVSCSSYDDSLALDPSLGDHVIFGSSVGVATRAETGQPSSPWVQLAPGDAEIVLPDLHLLIGPAAGRNEFELCR
jgi:hypothetical protein